MTTIVYNGKTKTIAIDSMTTHTQGAIQHRVENSYKIEDLTPFNIITSQGEKLIALCFAGTVSAFERASDFVLKNLHNWRHALENIQSSGGCMFAEGQRCRVLMITSKKVRAFSFNQTVSCIEYKLNDFVAIGSGANAASTAHHVYGADAIDALKAAMVVDDSTGYLLHTLTVTTKGLQPSRALYINDVQAEILAMRRRAGRNTVIDLPRDTAPMEKRYQSQNTNRVSKLKKIKEREKKERVKFLEQKAKADVPATEPAVEPKVLPKRTRLKTSPPAKP